MDNFDAHKWFKKEYLGEGHTEDKTERDQFIRRYDQLSNDDKLKLAKIQAMMDRERSLKEDDLNEITEKEAYFKAMEGLANQRDLNELKDLIMILGGEWANEGFENEDIVDYFEDLVYKLVRS